MVRRVFALIIIILILFVTGTLIMIFEITDSNSRLIERVFYRLGFQEITCSDLTSFEKIIENNEERKDMISIASVGDVGMTKNSIETLKNMNKVKPNIFLFAGDFL